MDCFAKVKNRQVNYLQRYKRKQKEQTIRKVMGERAIFKPHEFFSLTFPLYDFFIGQCRNIF